MCNYIQCVELFKCVSIIINISKDWIEEDVIVVRNCFYFMLIIFKIFVDNNLRSFK